VLDNAPVPSGQRRTHHGFSTVEADKKRPGHFCPGHPSIFPSSNWVLEVKGAKPPKTSNSILPDQRDVNEKPFSGGFGLEISPTSGNACIVCGRRAAHAARRGHARRTHARARPTRGERMPGRGPGLPGSGPPSSFDLAARLLGAHVAGVPTAVPVCVSEVAARR